MLVFGKVSKINEDDFTVKLKLEDYETETVWLTIPQLWVKDNKSGYLPDIDSLGCAVLTEDMTEGIFIGAKYNDKDKALFEYKGKAFIKFSDGVCIEHTPDTGALILDATLTEITSNLVINGDTIFNGNVVVNGNSLFNGNIVCTGHISDFKGSIQEVREAHNNHKHTNGNGGQLTGAPVEEM